MDPNEALRRLKDMMSQPLNDMNQSELRTAFRELTEQFEALEGWIKKGGFLPSEWAPAKAVATIEEPAKTWTKDCGLSQYRVICTGLLEDDQNCGPQHLTEKQYEEQLRQPNKRWRCPVCRAEATWDDDWYESAVVAMGGENVE